MTDEVKDEKVEVRKIYAFRRGPLFFGFDRHGRLFFGGEAEPQVVAGMMLPHEAKELASVLDAFDAEGLSVPDESVSVKSAETSTKL